MFLLAASEPLKPLPANLAQAFQQLYTIIGDYFSAMRFCLVFFIFLSVHATAQVPKLYNHVTNDVQLIHSRILNQDRQIYIHVPTLDSANTGMALPVLYLLDGENHFHILSAYIEYLRRWRVIPPMIVVGIINVDRVKDLTPTKSLINFDGKVDSNYKASGGNEQFLNFIQQELMPYVKNNYKTSDYKVLAGHSFGGLAVIHCLLTRPDMFDAYIAISPSLWFGNKYVLRLAEQKITKLSINSKKLFYSVGNEEDSFRNDILSFNKLVKQTSLKTFEHEYKYYPSEDHMTEPIPAYYDALKFVFKKWNEQKTK